ncbi:MAG: Hpt domain-containing protein [Sinobacterium sp.]|nr:Hpt domain-containing protein [Sinobacterium sp.]
MCVDESSITQLKELMGDDFSLLVSTFIKDSNLKIDTMRTTIFEQDADNLRMAAHGLKGSALNLSAAKLTELCRELESLGKEGSFINATQLVDAIEQEYKAVTGYLVSI